MSESYRLKMAIQRSKDQAERLKEAIKNSQEQRVKLRKIQGLPLHHNSGKKSIYSELIAELICSRIAAGEPLARICKEEGMPTAQTVMDWVQQPDEDIRPGFVEQYLRSKETGYLLMADEIIEIADNSGKDKKKIWVNGKEIEVIDHENIQRDKLRVDTRKWTLSKVLPKIYGDTIKVDVSVSVDLVGRLAAARLRLINTPEDDETNLIEAAPDSFSSSDDVDIRSEDV